MEIEYEILMEKKTSRIKDLEERIEQLKTQSDPVKQEEISIIIGYYKYLIGLQYGYLQKDQEKQKFLSEALKLCEGTGYEDQIKQHM